MFARELRQWRTIQEGYKGTFTPGKGFNLPDEKPSDDQAEPGKGGRPIPTSFKPKGKPTMAGPTRAPAGTLSSTNRKPMPPALPRKSPPPLPR